MERVPRTHGAELGQLVLPAGDDLVGVGTAIDAVMQTRAEELRDSAAE